MPPRDPGPSGGLKSADVSTLKLAVDTSDAKRAVADLRASLRPPLSASTQRLILAIAALAALLLALGGVGLFAVVSTPDPVTLAAVLGIIGPTLGGSVTLAFHAFFREAQAHG